MSRYIDAKEVEKRIDVVIGSEPKAWDKKALKELKMYVVHAVPTADVRENVRGEWIRRDSRYVGWISFDCSVCGETLELDRETSNDFKYCPFCGADMKQFIVHGGKDE